MKSARNSKYVGKYKNMKYYLRKKLLYNDKSILPEDIAIININASNNRVSKFTEVKMKIIKERNRHIKEYSCRFDRSFC